MTGTSSIYGKYNLSLALTVLYQLWHRGYQSSRDHWLFSFSLSSHMDQSGVRSQITFWHSMHLWTNSSLANRVCELCAFLLINICECDRPESHAVKSFRPAPGSCRNTLTQELWWLLTLDLDLESTCKNYSHCVLGCLWDIPMEMTRNCQDFLIGDLGVLRI